MPSTASLTGLGTPPALAEQLGWIEYAGNPTNNVTPKFIGQWCFDTANANLYVATTILSSGWKTTT